MDRITRVRAMTRRRQLLIGMVVVALAVPLVAIAASAKPDSAQGPDKKVWVCHFDGHEAGTSWDGGRTTLDGDYVLAYVDGMPLEFQRAYCEDGVGASPGGGNLILISSNALGGHGAQLAERVAGYPDGYRG